MEVMGNPRPLHHLLAELCSLSLSNYRRQICGWLQRNLLHLKCASTWCCACGQLIDDYYDHLEQDGPADGLEVLLVSVALDMVINIVLDDVVWTTSLCGVDFHNPTVLVSTVVVYACVLHDSLEGNVADIDTSGSQENTGVKCMESTGSEGGMTLLQNHPHGGRPLMTECAVDSDSGSTTDTNPDMEFITQTIPCKKCNDSESALQLCVIRVHSMGALAFHLKLCHPESRLYHCVDCEGAYNTKGDLASHVFNAHSVHKVHCKHCEYVMTTAARMHFHIQKHTSGIQCHQCGHKYPNSHSLKVHEALYGVRQPHKCGTCGKVFATSNSLRIHHKGVHGEGYVCKCGLHFTSPVQRCRHQ